jgi:hypothetical protein
MIENGREFGRRALRTGRHLALVDPQAAWDVATEVRRAPGITVAILRSWEQNRVSMEPATIALVRILAREPEAALRALGRPAA